MGEERLGNGIYCSLTIIFLIQCACELSQLTGKRAYFSLWLNKNVLKIDKYNYGISTILNYNEDRKGTLS